MRAITVDQNHWMVVEEDLGQLLSQLNCQCQVKPIDPITIPNQEYYDEQINLWFVKVLP